MLSSGEEPMSGHIPALLLLSAGWLSAQRDIRVALLVSAPEATPAGVIEEAAAELARVLVLPRAVFTWHELETATSSTAADLFIVIRFQGHCRPTATRLRELPNGPLGYAAISGGEVQPFIEVECERVMEEVARAVIGSARMSVPGFARALARVTAHELYHVLSRSEAHDQSGLSKRVLTPEDLCRPCAGFSREAVERMTRRLAEQFPEIAEGSTSTK